MLGESYRVPLFPRRHAPHTVQFVQDALQTGQNGSVQLHGERALQPRLVLGLSEQPL